jgi:hypothetical protein
MLIKVLRLPSRPSRFAKFMNTSKPQKIRFADDLKQTGEVAVEVEVESLGKDRKPGRGEKKEILKSY